MRWWNVCLSVSTKKWAKIKLHHCINYRCHDKNVSEGVTSGQSGIILTLQSTMINHSVPLWQLHLAFHSNHWPLLAALKALAFSSSPFKSFCNPIITITSYDKKVQKYFRTISKHNFSIVCDISTDCACTLLNKDPRIMEKKKPHMHVYVHELPQWFSWAERGRTCRAAPSGRWAAGTRRRPPEPLLCSQTGQTNRGGETRQERINDAQEISFFLMLTSAAKKEVM